MRKKSKTEFGNPQVVSSVWALNVVVDTDITPDTKKDLKKAFAKEQAALIEASAQAKRQKDQTLWDSVNDAEMINE